MHVFVHDSRELFANVRPNLPVSGYACFNSYHVPPALYSGRTYMSQYGKESFNGRLLSSQKVEPRQNASCDEHVSMILNFVSFISIYDLF